MSKSLGFLNHVSTQPTATLKSYQSIIENHDPNAKFFFSVDGGPTPSVLYKNTMHQYKNSEWLFNKMNLGYPPYSLEKVLEWLHRTYVGVSRLGTSHWMMLEDDCLIINPIQFEYEWEYAGHTVPHGNKIPRQILDKIEFPFCGNITTDYYGCGGGTIFDSQIFLHHYRNVILFFKSEWELLQQIFHPPCGYMDCYMQLFYMLAGCNYVSNPRLANIDPHDPIQGHLSKHGTENEIVLKYKKDYDIVHNVKIYYTT